ncbi:hypothetical protein P4H71_01220 [Paenibacillus kribbensis]|uniref:hypothetical protein n=1 Tax=Paenibacillus kribbensis TaxID=172713 RepID=UPI002DBDE146|nr:hypothetical protein [Paenibacillus kribbensis]MEC0232976.1 hypothetical protein [Paenibacillus kribbensis]
MSVQERREPTEEDKKKWGIRGCMFIKQLMRTTELIYLKEVIGQQIEWCVKQMEILILNIMRIGKKVILRLFDFIE